MNSISYMPKLVSDFELSNKLIDEAKIKAKPESERIKKSQKQELITILVKNGISKKEAIKMAILMAKRGDVIVVAGKGHENYQIIGDKVLHFSDRETINEIWKN